MTLEIWQVFLLCSIFYTSGLGTMFIIFWASWLLEKYRMGKAISSADSIQQTRFAERQKTSSDGY